MKKHFTLLALLLAGLVDIKAQKLTDSLIVYYNFQGDGKDNSGNNLDGTVNGPTLTVDRLGNLNSAYSFDGIDDMFNFPSSNKMKPTLPISVSFWIKSEKLPNWVFSNNYHNNSYNGITVNISTEGKIALSFGDDGGAGSGNRRGKTSNLAISKSKWHHIVGVIKGADDILVYIDAVEAGGTYSGTASTLKYTNAPGSIGNFEVYGTNPLTFFQGSIDKFAMWHRDLSYAEVQELYTKYLDVIPEKTYSSISILPNPAFEIISISSNQMFYGVKYGLLDLTGRIVNEGIIDSDLINVDIRNLSSGMYILKIGYDSYKVLKN